MATYIFNIIYTIAKMINNYFSKKILFVDIYNMFFILIPRIGKSKPRVMKLNDSVNELKSNQNYLDNSTKMYEIDNVTNNKYSMKLIAEEDVLCTVIPDFAFVEVFGVDFKYKLYK